MLNYKSLMVLATLLSACSASKRPPHVDVTRMNPHNCHYQKVDKGGAFYKDDGPGGRLPDNLDNIQTPNPKHEPLHRYANRPYRLLGKSYVPHTKVKYFVQEGVASWYGRKFHGQKTSSGE